MDCDLGENSWLIHWEMGQVLIYIFRAIKLMRDRGHGQESSVVGCGRVQIQLIV